LRSTQSKKGDADVAVSAGNTGALMAMSRFNLKMIEGIERPAIAALWPTLKGESVVLDVGASIGADEAHLVNLAAMGSAMARVLFDIERPTVGLLNIGVEEVKGLEQVREAGRILREGQFRISTTMASSRATISARVRWTSWSLKGLQATLR
jgi:glycerol-3-phosphate acyltransferase PlsX